MSIRDFTEEIKLKLETWVDQNWILKSEKWKLKPRKALRKVKSITVKDFFHFSVSKRETSELQEV